MYRLKPCLTESIDLSEFMPSLQSSFLRILVVDDHELTRFSLKVALRKQSNIELVGIANNGLEAVKIAAASLPDVIILDLQMPVMDGATASKQIKRINPGIKIIGYSSIESPEARSLLDAATLDAFCDKATQTSELIGLAWRLAQKIVSD